MELEGDPVLELLVDLRLEDVGQLVAVEVFEREHAFRRQVVIDKGDQDLFVVLEHLREEVGVAGLQLVVEFLAEALLHLLVKGIRIDRLAEHVTADEREGVEQGLEVLQVLLDGLFDSRILHLDHDLGAVVELSAVDLAERRGGKGCLVERSKEVLDLVPQLGLDPFADHGEVHGRHVGLHDRKDIQHLAGEDVAAHAEHLHQLQKRPAQFLGTLDDQQCILEMRIENGLRALFPALEGALQGIQEVVPADLRGQRTDLHRTPGATGSQRAVAAFARLV